MSALICVDHYVVVYPSESTDDLDECMFVTAERAIVWTSEAARAAAFETMFEAAEDAPDSSPFLAPAGLTRAMGLTLH